ncbi:MAG: NifB/NifX family molybdenum-iron cluster-binding protein [Candidatus Zixiibacteriota bacterium]
MIIAIPSKNNKIFPQFGRAKEFTVIEVDTEKKSIIKTELLTNDKHDHGFPHWLFENNIDTLIISKIGEHALGKLNEIKIGYITGAPAKCTPEELVALYLNGELVTGNPICKNSKHRNPKKTVKLQKLD